MDCLPDMAHRWRISEADGDLSPGTCCYCGQTNMFKNSIPWLMEMEVGHVGPRALTIKSERRKKA
jgi:hypothetical protein